MEKKSVSVRIKSVLSPKLCLHLYLIIKSFIEMARVQNTLIGKSSGSVGGATFSTWKGINVLKSKAISVANPRTVKQQTQRNRMTLMVGIFRLLSSIINVGFKTSAVGKSEYNAFVSENIQDATVVTDAPEVTLQLADLKIAKGSMGTTPISGINASTGSNVVELEWDTELNPVGSSPQDIAQVAIYDAEEDVWHTAQGTQRNEGFIEVSVTPNLQGGGVLNAFLFFKSADSDEVSDSIQEQVQVSE